MSNLTSWIEVPQGSDFPIQNLPFGVFSHATLSPKPSIGVRVGNQVVSLKACAMQAHLFDDLGFDTAVFAENTLNSFIACGQKVWRSVRQRLIDALRHDSSYTLRHLHEHAVSTGQSSFVLSISEVQMHLPVQIGDYTDFYSSIEHATNVGTMFRDPANALLPNWKHLPVGYHGRASSIVISGTDVHRPKGQTKPADAPLPVFGATKMLDFELEMAFIVGKNTQLGDSVSTHEAEEHIFGFALFNDWSARDVQTWEYVPLGPFLSKNFASSMSAWIVTLDALEPFRVAGPVQDPAVLPYLAFDGAKNYDIQLEVFLKPEGGTEQKICTSNFKYMYWNIAQQLAHHTVNGCNINIGDLYASGTISGSSPDSYGSMLELTWRGTKPLLMADGTERKFILDGDTIIMRGFAQKDNLRVGFGEVKGKILPTK